MRITFVGGGNMASALMGGLLQRGHQARDLQVVEISEAARARLAQTYGVRTFAHCVQEALIADVVVLAVKPQQMREVALALRPHVSQQLILTIAAGVRVADLSRWLGGYAQIARAMPNTPALVLSGTSALYAGEKIDATQREQASGILGAVGSVIWVEQESLLDAVTAVSGSGPAYVFYFIEAIQEAALQLGLTEQQARTLVIDTFLGAAKLVAQSDESAAVLRERVTSKGGTTERALAHFGARELKEHIIAAVKAAAERSCELGDTFGQSD